MMRLCNLIFISIFAIARIRCYPSHSENADDKNQDLALILNMMHELANLQKDDQPYYNEYLSVVAQVILVPQRQAIAETLSKFISRASILREALLKEDDGSIYINDGVTDAPKICFYIVSLNDILLDLQDNIAKWESRSQGDLAIKKVTDQEPLLWFNKHGFDGEDIRDVAIDELKTLIGSILGNGNPLESLLSFLRASYSLQPDPDLSCPLIWLTVFSASSEAIDSLERQLYLESGDLPRETVVKLVDSLRQLGVPDSPLSKLVNESKDDGPDTFHIKVIKGTVFDDSKMKQYLDILYKMCRFVEEEIAQAAELLERLHGPVLVSSFKQMGFDFTGKHFNSKSLSRELKGLMSEDGPITNLCDVAREQYYLFDSDDEDLDSPVSIHLRSS